MTESHAQNCHRRRRQRESGGSGFALSIGTRCVSPATAPHKRHDPTPDGMDCKAEAKHSEGITLLPSCHSCTILVWSVHDRISKNACAVLHSLKMKEEQGSAVFGHK